MNTGLSKSKIFAKDLFSAVLKKQMENKLEQLRKYTLEIESKFSADKNDLKTEYEAAVRAAEEEDENSLLERFSETYYEIEEINTNIYRKSTLVYIYSFLENSMNAICRNLQKGNAYPVLVEDLKGEGIVRAKMYLEKLAEIDFIHLNTEWSKLMTLNKVRNCIVHVEGNFRLLNSPEKFETMINQTKGLSISRRSHLKVEREYVDFCIDAVESFLNSLHIAVNKA